MKNLWTLLGYLLAAVIAVPPAQAQIQSSAELEEVVVTARKRDESFTDVPAAINAFTERDIESAGIEKPRDFVALTPNVTLVETQNQGNAFLVIRGISQARNSEPSAAILIDGVQLTNPAQFNQDLFDIEQIEVVKGPQGALYGRNAIGGAIIIRTKQPSDEYEGKALLGYDSGPGYKLRGGFSGPVPGTDHLKFRGALSVFDTDGYIDNPFLGEEADPYKDVSGRLRAIWTPTDRFALDARVSASQVDTQALYFNIVADADDTSLPVRVNNAGENGRDIYNVSLKVDYEADAGTFTSITSFDDLEEILTGDAFDFLPIAESFFFTSPFSFLQGIADLNQSQFLDVETVSQEFRFTSPSDRRFRWIAGTYFVGTDRYISTGNMLDIGMGVFPVFREPSTNPLNPQVTFLADEQDNFAWAVFGDISYDISDQLELSFALRYDEDIREQTTLTPPAFLALVNVPGFPAGFTGQKRKNTWTETQPKVTLRYQPSDSLTVYGGYSRGFRSGGFNQTGVGAIAFSTGFLGVGDLFDAEVADTIEAGIKGQWFDGRLRTNISVFHTEAEGSYFFVFLPANSTQNLGNLDGVDYMGLELEAAARLAEGLDLNLGWGLTDSEITAAADPTVIGNEAPLVSAYTLNVGLQYRRALANLAGWEGFARIDYQGIGETWWDPQNSTTRSPIQLVDLRLGLEHDHWQVTAWSRNLNDEDYNAEFSPGGFVFKAPPRRWGVDFTYRF